MRKEMERLRLGDVGVAPHLVWTDVPPWILPMPEIDMTVMSLAKAGFNYVGSVSQALIGWFNFYFWCKTAAGFGVCLVGWCCRNLFCSVHGGNRWTKGIGRSAPGGESEASGTAEPGWSSTWDVKLHFHL
uniref:Uncharacterized protein n=1 Tax=Knipowitschia caucasica TaxID=637954 RepID=A0AAV2IZK2_KNICA